MEVPQTPFIPIAADSEEPFRLLAEASTDLISRHAPDGTYLYASPAAYTLLGYRPDELIGRSAYEFFHPDDLAAVAKSHQTIVETPVTYTVVYRIRRKDGAYIWFETTSRTIRDETGVVQTIYSASRDISRRKAIEERLRESEARFRSAFDDAAIGMAMVSLDGHFSRVNRSLCKLVGYSEQALLQTNFQTLTHPDDLAGDLANVQALMNGERDTFQMEKRYLHKRGHIVWVLLNVSLVRNEAKAPLYFISQIQDITIRKEMEQALRDANEQLQKLATQDSLTGLLNHRTFNERLHEEIQRAARHQTPLSLLILDADRFKQYNDNFGHLAGDKVLTTLAALLKQNARTTDQIARYGGEEFAVILPETDAEGASYLAERLRHSIEHGPWKHRRVTASVGAATLSATIQDGKALIAAADKALYEAKAQGRNRAIHIQQLDAEKA